MTLEFLPYLSAGLDLMGGLSAAQNTAKGYVAPDAEKYQLGALAAANQMLGSQGQVLGNQAQSLSNQNRLLQAYLNPNDPITKNLYSAESQQLNNNTQLQLSNLLAANRKAQLMGRQSFFNPERQDESISQFLSRASDSNANTARSNALQRIMDASNGYANGAQGYASNASGIGNLANNYGANGSRYGTMIDRQVAAQMMNDARAPALYGAASDALGSGGSLSNIFSLIGGGGKGGSSGGGSSSGGLGSLASLASLATLFI